MNIIPEQPSISSLIQGTSNVGAPVGASVGALVGEVITGVGALVGVGILVGVVITGVGTGVGTNFASVRKRSAPMLLQQASQGYSFESSW